jgi:PAS domain-containing protein
MTQKAIEVILARQLADYLGTPMFIVDPVGTLLFYNEAAEAILGRRFQETGEMPVEKWGTMFIPRDDEGKLIAPADLPLVIALTHNRLAYRNFWITGMDRVPRHISVAAMPLIDRNGQTLGAVAIFWPILPADGTATGSTAEAA